MLVSCRGTCALKHVQRPEAPQAFPPLSNPNPWTSGTITTSTTRTVPPRPPLVPSALLLVLLAPSPFALCPSPEAMSCQHHAGVTASCPEGSAQADYHLWTCWIGNGSA